MFTTGDIVTSIFYAPLTALVCFSILIFAWRIPSKLEYLSENAPEWVFNAVGISLWGIALLWYVCALDAWLVFIGAKNRITNPYQFWDAALKVHVFILAPLFFVGRVAWISADKRAYNEGYQAAMQQAQWERKQGHREEEELE